MDWKIVNHKDTELLQEVFYLIRLYRGKIIILAGIAKIPAFFLTQNNKYVTIYMKGGYNNVKKINAN